jgi:hypothetical protein
MMRKHKVVREEVKSAGAETMNIEEERKTD